MYSDMKSLVITEKHIEVFVSFREKTRIQQIPRLMNC